MYSTQPVPMTPPHGLSGALKLLGQDRATVSGNRAVAQWGQNNKQGGISGQGMGGAGSPTQKGIRNMNAFVNPGKAATGVQAALSGAMGPEAQAEAYAQFQESPAQAFLREQGERAVMRNAAAMGGLGGGNVMKELTRYGQGVAAQDFDNYYSRLGTVADRGLQGAAQQTSLYDRQAAAATAREQMQAQLQAAAIGAGGTITAAGISNQTDLMRDAGRYAYDAGLQNANNIARTSSSLSQYIDNQGTGMGQRYSTGTGNLASILMGGGQATSDAAMNRGNTLGGMRLTGSGQYAGLTNLGGRSPDNTLQNVGNIASAVGGLF